MTQLKPCPFCGSNPVAHVGKKQHCQLHGEPFQGVIIRCKAVRCPAHPQIEAGDIYNGGQDKAREEAAEIWNRRAPNQAICDAGDQA